MKLNALTHQSTILLPENTWVVYETGIHGLSCIWPIRTVTNVEEPHYLTRVLFDGTGFLKKIGHHYAGLIKDYLVTPIGTTSFLNEPGISSLAAAIKYHGCE